MWVLKCVLICGRGDAEAKPLIGELYPNTGLQTLDPRPRISDPKVFDPRVMSRPSTTQHLIRNWLSHSPRFVVPDLVRQPRSVLWIDGSGDRVSRL